jgi:hypothetical protein
MESARIRRFLGLTQRDVSTATGILISRISACERGVLRLSSSERAVLRAFLRDRLQVVLAMYSEDERGIIPALSVWDER